MLRLSVVYYRGGLSGGAGRTTTGRGMPCLAAPTQILRIWQAGRRVTHTNVLINLKCDATRKKPAR
jgi:hypothetical protein